MPERVVAATLTAPRQFELRDYPLPDIGPDAGLLRLEACGVCGADVRLQQRETSPCILGHENVGVIARLGAQAARKWGLREGDRVAVEEYLPCGACDLCRSGDYRYCDLTDLSAPGEHLFYGFTPTAVPPSLWGGYSQYLYLHPNAVLHRLPADIPANLATFYLPLSNGIEWTCRYGEATLGDTVVVQGPGQQGLSCVVAAQEAGAACIIVSGRTRDAQRLNLARKLGAHHTIDIERESFRERVMDITGGRGVNVVVNVTGGGTSVVSDALSVASKARCTIVLAAAGTETISVGGWGRKRISLRWANGHSYRSVERAIQLIASRTYPLDELCTHTFGMADVGLAIRTVAGDGVPPGIHVVIRPEL